MHGQRSVLTVFSYGIVRSSGFLIWVVFCIGRDGDMGVLLKYINRLPPCRPKPNFNRIWGEGASDK